MAATGDVGSLKSEMAGIGDAWRLKSEMAGIGDVKMSKAEMAATGGDIWLDETVVIGDVETLKVATVVTGGGQKTKLALESDERHHHLPILLPVSVLVWYSRLGAHRTP